MLVVIAASIRRAGYFTTVSAELDVRAEPGMMALRKKPLVSGSFI